MSDAHQDSPDLAATSQNSSDHDLDSLRSLLLGPEIERRLKFDRISSEDVATVLPDAIIQSRENQEKLVAAVVPTVEEAIKSSVKSDFNVLSDTLFPVIGPATRKAVSTAIKNLTDSLNQGLEQSLSPQSFKWRFEAWRTGKSFAEVMLLRTLLFQVEQVLLIHKETGLVLQDIEVETVTVRDPDLVSAMLTAIQDFIRDSFSVNTGSSLDTLEFGNLTLWVEDGPKAVLACVIRGVAPSALRTLMQYKLEKLHVIFERELVLFEGDQTLFEGAKSHLEECLQSQYKTAKERKFPFLGVLVLLLTIGLGGYLIRGAYLSHQWRAVVQKFDRQPGIVVLNSQRTRGIHIVEGMRDPSAPDPQTFFTTEGFEAESLKMSWEPYWSMHPKFLTARATKLLDPPSSITLSVDPNLELQASGIASKQWVTQARQLSDRIDGLSGWDESQVTLSEQQALLTLKEQIESQALFFIQGSTQLAPQQDSSFQKTAADLQKIHQLSRILGQKIEVTISGQTDPVGSIEDNARLSQSRADTMIRLFIAEGIPKEILKAKGQVLNSAQLGGSANEAERRVSFQVSLIQDKSLQSE